MSDLNCCSFTGRLTKDAEMKMIGAKQTPCTEFSIANNTGYGQFEKTTYISVQVWGARGTSLMDYLKKGTRVAVAGELTQNDWVDQNGGKHTMFRLSANSVVLLGSPKNAGAKDTGNSLFDESEAVF